MEANLKFDKDNNCHVNIDTGEAVVGDFESLNKRIRYSLDTIMHFGKFNGRSVSEILYDVDNRGFSYLYWMFDEGFVFDGEVIEKSNEFTKVRMEQQDLIPVGVHKATRQVEFVRRENLISTEIKDKKKRHISFTENTMLKKLLNHFNGKHSDIAFDETDMCIGDF